MWFSLLLIILALCIIYSVIIYSKQLRNEKNISLLENQLNQSKSVNKKHSVQIQTKNTKIQKLNLNFKKELNEKYLNIKLLQSKLIKNKEIIQSKDNIIQTKINEIKHLYQQIEIQKQQQMNEEFSGHMQEACKNEIIQLKNKLMKYKEIISKTETETIQNKQCNITIKHQLMQKDEIIYKLHHSLVRKSEIYEKDMKHIKLETENQLAKCKHMINQLKKRINKLHHSLVQKSEIYAKNMKHIKLETENQLSKSKHMINQLKKRINKFENNQNILNKKISEKNRNIQKLNQHIIKLTEENDSIKLRNKQLIDERSKAIKQSQNDEYEKQQIKKEKQDIENQKKLIELKNNIILSDQQHIKSKYNSLKHQANKLKVACVQYKEEKRQFEHKANEEEQKAIQKEKQLKKLSKKNNQWIPYKPSINKIINQLNINETYQYKAQENGKIYKIKKLSDDYGIQTNIATNIVRPIRKIKTMNFIKYPKWWDKSYNNVNYGQQTLFNMNPNHYKAKEIQNLFHQTATNCKIIKIEFIQNQMLYDAYFASKQKLEKLIGPQKLNQQFLFHGTKNEDIMSKIQKEGFRKEFNYKSKWGEGTYFAKNAGFSVHYSFRNHHNVWKMFGCLVICGESKIGNNRYTLKNWPKKRNELIYDSLTDASGKMFVVHEDSRAYPMVIIHFTRNQN